MVTDGFEANERRRLYAWFVMCVRGGILPAMYLASLASSASLMDDDASGSFAPLLPSPPPPTPSTVTPDSRMTRAARSILSSSMSSIARDLAEEAEDGGTGARAAAASPFGESSASAPSSFIVCICEDGLSSPPPPLVIC